MLGNPDCTEVESVRGFKVKTYPGREQPYTVWRGNSTWYFAETWDEARQWISKQPAAHAA